MKARQLIKHLLLKKGYRIERVMPLILLEDVQLRIDLDFLILHEIFRRGEDFTFVQIGANDGVSRHDDFLPYIRRFDVQGVLVEPQPNLFQTLCTNLGKYPRLKLINKAIHRDRSSMTLYRFDPQHLSSDLPHWARTNGAASFDKQHVLKHARSLYLGEDVIQALEVECLTLRALLEEVDGTLDMLKVDVEGYDYEVINMLDLERHCPTIIHFEHAHMNNEQYESVIMRLINAGYRFLADSTDTTAYSIDSPAYP